MKKIKKLIQDFKDFFCLNITEQERIDIIIVEDNIKYLRKTDKDRRDAETIKKCEEALKRLQEAKEWRKKQRRINIIALKNKILDKLKEIFKKIFNKKDDKKNDDKKDDKKNDSNKENKN